MFPSSSSSTSHKSIGSTSTSGGGGAAGGGGGGLARYGSAPSSFLSTAVESAAAEREFSPHSSTAGHYFTGENEPKPGSGAGLQRSYGFNNADSSTASYLKLGDSSLVRQRSSPAGFLTSDSSGGFSVSRGPGVSRLNPQLSFTGQDSVPLVNENVRPENCHQKASHAYASASFGVDSWENTGSIVFSAPSSKRAKNMDADFLNYASLESQFSLPHTSLEIPEDSIACKIRAKRGCATHPRSIAERERRIRISGKLKKLQDLVPNMDKQTSYADMLDLAVQHIKGLQNQVQNLHKGLERCTCGCKPSP